MERLGEIEVTEVREHYAMATVPFPIDLNDDSPVDLANVTLHLSDYTDAVLLQATVNWSANFTIPPANELMENGLAEATFQFLRDGQIIYQVTQTIRQKDFEPVDTIQTKTTFEMTSLLHLDITPLSGSGRVVTYTLRASEIALFAQNGTFAGGSPAVTAAVGSVTFAAQECTGSTQSNQEAESDLDDSGWVFIDENTAPQPATIPFPIQLEAGDSVELASLEIGADESKQGILLTAVVNWSLRVTSNGLSVLPISSGMAKITFEFVRNGEVVYIVNHSAIQPYIENISGLIESTTFEIADLSFLDTPSRRSVEEPNTYTLRAAHIAVLDPIIAGDGSAATTVSVGSVTLTAQQVEVKKTRKRRR